MHSDSGKWRIQRLAHVAMVCKRSRSQDDSEAREPEQEDTASARPELVPDVYHAQQQ